MSNVLTDSLMLEIAEHVSASCRIFQDQMSRRHNILYAASVGLFPRAASGSPLRAKGSTRLEDILSVAPA